MSNQNQSVNIQTLQDQASAVQERDEAVIQAQSVHVKPKTPKTVMVINKKGSMGKTHIVNVLSPYFKVHTVDILNSEVSGSFSADDTIRLMSALRDKTPSIIDVGASEYVSMVTQLQNNPIAIRMVDSFVVPILPDEDSQEQSTQTIADLLDLGVPSSKIKILFNRFKRNFRKPSKFSDEFGGFIDIAESFGISCDTSLIFTETDFPMLLRKTGVTTGEAFNLDAEALVESCTDNQDDLELATLASIAQNIQLESQSIASVLGA